MIVKLTPEIFSRTQAARHIGVIGHREPDGDALGCLLAFSKYLDRLEKSHTMFTAGAEIHKWHFLPGHTRVYVDFDRWKEYPYDLLVFFDTPDLGYANLSEWDALQGDNRPFIINIDHHHDNDHYGDINLVMSDFPAATHVLYDMFCHAGVTIDREMAICLLCGILIDTSHFSNAATTDRVLEVASDLVRRGASLPKLVKHMWQQEHVDTLTLWGYMFSRLKHNETLGVVSAVLEQVDFENLEGDADGMANFLNSIGEGKCALLLKESEPGVIKGSFRTTRDDVDVSRLARLLGGGGHRRAAGFTVRGRLVREGGRWRVV